jgi:hypothetical protein
MAIPSNQLPFEVKFYQYDTEIPITRFWEDPDAVEVDDKIPYVTENKDLTVLFACADPNARFYMDGLEVLSERAGVDYDEYRNPYLPPDQVPHELFLTQGQEYYPLIPGYYRVSVMVHSRVYHSLLQVRPKQMSNQQWEIMRDELEGEVRGLAQDLIRKNLSLSDPFFDFLPPEQLFHFLVINKRFSSVMTALSDLSTKVNFRIRKDYRIVPVDRAKAIDEKTVRHRLTHPEIQGVLKTPVREIDYDLPENRWVKRIVRLLDQKLVDVEAAMKRYRVSLVQELEDTARFYERGQLPAYLREKKRVLDLMDEYIAVAEKMRYGLQIIKLSEWYDQVSTAIGTEPTSVLMYDSRYRSLYQLYRELRSEQLDVSLDTTYSFQWKRTDQLYEIWGFLQLCKVLTRQLGFTGKRGWLFDRNFEGGRLLIPTLPQDTTIVLEKGEVRLHLVYNAVIPTRVDQTSQDKSPLFMLLNYHLRPDARLDVYRNGVYGGSLIFEFKYRPRTGRYPFWDLGSDLESRRPSATNQLISYYSNSSSRYLYGDYVTDQRRGLIRAVYETWALYPRHNNPHPPSEYFDSHHVRLLMLTPGEENEWITQELEKAIADILQLTEEYARHKVGE